ncbi:hypothetical protein E2C01_067209 [Portunus trituberculatus]|uniref:Uncharacterized protein n=1 Tax=Portunus trituberculatus TaxID=210409 RepID=A0A5B7HT09_PORTR|nr:hypothetical protein [Portunus trituberculatus]
MAFISNHRPINDETATEIAFTSCVCPTGHNILIRAGHRAPYNKQFLAERCTTHVMKLPQSSLFHVCCFTMSCLMRTRRTGSDVVARQEH